MLLADEMLERARKAMFPPFAVSLCADPSGAYTTAAAMVASVEAALRKQGAGGLAGKRVLLLGGTGPVGRVAAVLCAQCGATAVIASHKGDAAASLAAKQTGERFGVTLESASSANRDDLRAALADTEVVMGVAAAGVEVMGEADRAAAKRLAVAADVNAVPPAGPRRRGRDGRRAHHRGPRPVLGHRRARDRQRQVPGAAIGCSCACARARRRRSASPRRSPSPREVLAGAAQD